MMQRIKTLLPSRAFCVVCAIALAVLAVATSGEALLAQEGGVAQAERAKPIFRDGQAQVVPAFSDRKM